VASPPPPPETFDLLERWRAGDPEALDRLLARDLDWLRAVVHRRLGTGLRKLGDTDDFVQEAALRVLRSGPRFVIADREQFRALLATIVINVIRNGQRDLHALRRTPQREQPLPSDTVLYLDPPHRAVGRPDQAAANAEQREWLRLGLLLLEPDDQQVLDRHWQGLADREIGAALGIAENAARMRRARATARLGQVVLKLKAGRVADVVG
jgi:RNA polymerase sigma-70 factor (ECF subfamily)